MFKQIKGRIFNFGVKMIKSALTEFELEKSKTINDQTTKAVVSNVENKYSQKNLENDLQFSEKKNESIKEWWERAHTSRNEFWLTGSTTGPEVWKYLEITGRLKAKAKVLNIGVGMGYCTHNLAKLGLTVHALDISKAALESVKDVAVCWTPDKLHNLPKNFFDVAISNLVAQHMSDEDLVSQIRGVCRSLKPNGVFAIQFAQNIDNKLIKNKSTVAQKTGNVLRTNKEFIKIVKEANGKIIRMWNGPSYPEFKSRWIFAHIGK